MKLSGGKIVVMGRMEVEWMGKWLIGVDRRNEETRSVVGGRGVKYEPKLLEDGLGWEAKGKLCSWNRTSHKIKI